MKKTSIVSLILSAVIIITGIIIMSRGSSKAEAEGIELFKQTATEDGDLIEKIELDGQTISKINISMGNTDIKVLGSADKSYIEIVNFYALEYTSYVSNNVLTVENDFITTLLNQFENGDLSFGGFRNYLRLKSHNDHKQINIYLSSDMSVKIFDMKIKSGQIEINNIANAADYKIKATDADIYLKNTPDSSSVSFDVEKGKVVVDSTSAPSINIKMGDGNVNLTTPADKAFNYRIKSEMGKVIVGGQNLGNAYEKNFDAATGNVVIDVKVGDAVITTGAAAQEPPAENATENTGETGDSEQEENEEKSE